MIGRTGLQSQLELQMHITPEVTAFFDDCSNTISYVVREPHGKLCAIIDPVMEFDAPSGRLTQHGANTMIAYIRDQDLRVEWILETHVHADHLSGAPYIQQQLGGKIGISKEILVVQDTFGKIFNEGTEFQRDGSQFDVLFADEDAYTLGEMTCMALHTPGHTPACMSHIMGNAIFVGDTMFMPDSGSARADFPGGDAGALYDSIMRLLRLPEETRLFVCHDYAPDGRDVLWETTIGEQRKNNIHVGGGKTREDFIRFRTERDAQLAMPTLILPSLQVNMRAGDVPKDASGDMMLKLPVNKISLGADP